MALSKCARCKKIYNKIASPICPKCEPEEDADFTKIHNVIGKNPGIRAEAIAELAGVDIEVVLRMLDGGRLRFEDVGDKPTCGRCGAPAISMSKRLCESCLAALDRECATAMRDLKKDFVFSDAKKSSSSVLGEKREELEKARTSETLKRANELEERVPTKASPTVARDARDKKDRFR